MSKAEHGWNLVQLMHTQTCSRLHTCTHTCTYARTDGLVWCTQSMF